MAFACGVTLIWAEAREAAISVKRRTRRIKFSPEALSSKEICKCLLHHFAINVRDRSGERNVLGTDLNAVLRVSAFMDAAIAHQRLQALVFDHFSRGMHVE